MDKDRYRNSALERVCKCGHRIKNHGYSGCQVGGCDCETDWMPDLPGGPAMASFTGAELAEHPEDREET